MSLWSFIKDNIVTIAATAAAAIATGGASLAIQAAVTGGALLIGASIDSDRKKKEAENKQLELKGEISKEIKQEIKNIQEERTQKASQLNTLDQQLVQKQNKLNDPNTPEHEKQQIRSEIASIVSKRDNIQREIKAMDDKINGLINTAQKNITGNQGGVINLKEMDQQTKMIIIGVIILFIYFTMVKEKEK